MHNFAPKIDPLISIIIPAHNEEKNIPLFFDELQSVLSASKYNFEILFVNDGSTDNTKDEINKLISTEKFKIVLLDFSKNFGKEAATSAGLQNSNGEASIIIDADLQHPIELIPEFLNKWEHGAEVVVGIRKKSKSDGFIKRFGSVVFYKILNLISETKLIPGSTDFRLLDRVVIDEFNKLSEHNRLTRGLIDWLGFDRSYIYFDANNRMYGSPAFNIIKLIRMAASSFVSLSLMPLRFAGYLGGFITIVSAVLGIVMFIDRYVKPLGFAFSGPAILANIILFLVGIVLISIGMLAVYIGNIYHEVQDRPLYIIRKNKKTRD